MTTFPRSPRLLKGAIIGVDPFNPLASVILFQYNPETLRRNLAARQPIPDPPQGGQRVAKGERIRLAGPPQETIQVEIELDATDQLEQAEAIATRAGIYPALSSLEMLLYPKALQIISNQALLKLGIKETSAPEAPLTLFVWGPKRVLPVQLTGFSITEELFDTDLNPIRASVSLSLTVLTYQDFERGLLHPGGAIFMVHQIAKEAMATINGLGNIASSASAVASVSLEL